jgi:hypothetical protein
MPSLTVVRTTELPPDWEAYARAHGTFYHLPQWLECLRDTYRFKIECYSARAEGELVGLLAVAQVPTLLGPRRLVSLPFSYAAGPLARNSGVADALAAAVREDARDRRIHRVELKSRGEFPPAPGFHRTSHYSTYEISIDGGEAAVWGRLHPGSTQRSIRKGQKAGLIIRRGESPEDWLLMARLEEQTAHSHGLPAPPRRFFTQGCWRLQQAGLAAAYLAFKENTPAAAISVWKGPRAWIYGFGASDPALLEHRPNHVLIWTAIQEAISAGCSFDLGRVAPEQEGLLEFKRRWGGQALPLAYDYWPEPGGLNVAARDRGSMATAAALWSRLPASVARLGAGLYRYLG